MPLWASSLQQEAKKILYNVILQLDGMLLLTIVMVNPFDRFEKTKGLFGLVG